VGKETRAGMTKHARLTRQRMAKALSGGPKNNKRKEYLEYQ